MITQGFGEVLTDALTANPALAELPSASAILDTSNYTFQSITFGKDAGGFQGFHSHKIIVPAATAWVNNNPANGASSYDGNVFGIINYAAPVTGESGTVSSYVTSATYAEFSSVYNSVPGYPSISDTRLERGSTLNSNLSSYYIPSALPDLGHYPNAAIDPQLSGIWNKIGGYPTSGNTAYIFYAAPLTPLFTYDLSSFYNANSLMDKDGYLTMSPLGLGLSGPASLYEEGAILVSAAVSSSTELLGVPVHPSGGLIKLSAVIRNGDAVGLTCFGGVKHIGVYCLDLKQMLSEGLLPPYSWDALNNVRKYKLVAKVTTLHDPLMSRDYFIISGLQDLLNAGQFLGSDLYAVGGPVVSIIFDFK